MDSTRPSLQRRRILASERVHFDQASAILDSNLEEAWGETKRRPNGGGARRPLFLSQHGGESTRTDNTRRHGKRLHCRLFFMSSFVLSPFEMLFSIDLSQLHIRVKSLNNHLYSERTTRISALGLFYTEPPLCSPTYRFFRRPQITANSENVC